MRRTAIAIAVATGLLGSGCSTTSQSVVRQQQIISSVDLPKKGEAREPAKEAGWNLVWSDDFDGHAIDRSKWAYDVDCWGGGNNERQCYTDRPSNSAVEDGKLVITARRETMTGPAFHANMRPYVEDPNAVATKDFTSARMVTRGKAAWQYGRIEVSAKLPQGQGTWPAIWMLPESNDYGSWALSGEIDILETVNLGVPCATCEGGRENTILGTLHFGGRPPENAFNSTETHAPSVLDDEFHTYGIVWTADRIQWTFDGLVYATKHRGDWWTEASDAPSAPFDRPFHLILNLAIGGQLSEGRGLKGVDNSGFPKHMVVDWVRVWECAPAAQGNLDCNGDD